MGSGTVTAITPRIIIEECVRRGINRKDLLDTVGISSDFLYQAAGRVPIEKMHVLWAPCLAARSRPDGRRVRR